jgi:hypothetical protein
MKKNDSNHSTGSSHQSRKPITTTALRSGSGKKNDRETQQQQQQPRRRHHPQQQPPPVSPPAQPHKNDPNNKNNNHNNHSNHDDDDDGQYKIHFLSALASVPVPFVLMTGMPIYTVSANGKTQPATWTFSTDRFTVYIRHHHHHSDTSGGGGGGGGGVSSTMSGGNHSNSTGGGGGGLSRAPSEKSLLGSSLFALGFSSNSSHNNSHNHHPNKVDERAIDIGEMDRVQRGQSTQQFELAKKNVKIDHNNNKVLDVLYKRAELQRNSSTSSNSSLPSTTTAAINQLDPALSFSIIFRGAHTVDLMAQTEKDRNLICNTLDQILQAYRRSKSRVSTDILLLRYVWLDVDKAKTGYVSVQQFWQALQAINFNKKMKEVTSDYEKFGRTIGLDKSERKRGLTFEQSATFLHKVKRM